MTMSTGSRSGWNADCALRAGAMYAPTAPWGAERTRQHVYCALPLRATIARPSMSPCRSLRASLTSCARRSQEQSAIAQLPESLRGRERSRAVHKTPIPVTGTVHPRRDRKCAYACRNVCTVVRGRSARREPCKRHRTFGAHRLLLPLTSAASRSCSLSCPHLACST